MNLLPVSLQAVSYSPISPNTALALALPQPITTRISTRISLPYTSRSITATNLVSVPRQPSSFQSELIPSVVCLNTHAFKERKGLGLIHLNIRSLLKPQKLDHIRVLVSQTDPDILVLSESWLKRSVNDSDVALPSFNIFRCDRNGKVGDIAIYVKSCFTVTAINAISIPKCYEVLILKVDLGMSNCIYLIGVYRPPSAVASSVDRLADLFSLYSDKELIILGDFNLDWLSSASSYLKEVTGNLGLSQVISEPTRPNPRNVSRSTLIDLIFSNKSDKISACDVFPLGISDHCPIACIRSSHLIKKKSLTVLRRNFKSFNEQAFIDDLITSNNLNLEITDVQVALDSFVNYLNTIVNKHAPLKRICIRDSVTPWFTLFLVLTLIQLRGHKR